MGEIKRGQTDVDNIYRGQDAVDNVYRGNTLIWSATSYDADAQAFFTAVEGGGDTLTTTEKDGTNTLVLAMKSSGVWDKLVAFYPFVGGTETSTKWNLKDPRDLDAAFRITWIGTSNASWNSKGYTQNGTDGTGASTNWNMSTYATDMEDNLAMGFYIYDKGTLSAGSGDNYDMGGYSSAADENMLIGGGFRSNANNTYINFGANSFETRGLSGDQAESFWIGDRSSTSQTALYKDGAQWDFTNTGTHTLLNHPMGLGCSLRNTNQPFESAARSYSMFFISEGLGSSLISTFNSDVSTWLTALSKTA